MATELYQIFGAVVAAGIGLVLDLTSAKTSGELCRAIHVCTGVLVEEINIQLHSANSQFTAQFNRLLAGLLLILKADKGSLGTELLPALEIGGIKPDVAGTVSRILGANTSLRRVEAARNRFKYFRWLFVFNMAAAIFVGAACLFWQGDALSTIVTIVLVAASVLLVAYLVDRAYTRSLLEDVESTYGLPSGK